MNDAVKLFCRMCGKIVGLALVVCFILRIVLIAITPGSLGISLGGWLAVFVLGMVNDLCVAIVSLLFLWLYLLTLTEAKYKKPWGYVVLAIPVALLVWVSCFNTPFHEYGSVVPKLAIGLSAFWTVSFALRLFVPKIRRGWSATWFMIFVTLYVGVIIFNAVSEYFFWNEFNVRYNFIAVDYLVYTNEVIGNIIESYSALPYLAVAGAALTVGISWWLFRRDASQLNTLYAEKWKLKCSLGWIVMAAISYWLVGFNTRFQHTGNIYYDELQANGVYKFIDAFFKNHLDYKQFYVTISDAEAEEVIHSIYGSTGHNFRHVSADSTAVFAPGARPNIVLITMESMSADFMARYGDTRGITPNIDSLAVRSMVFDNLIATGNRTVRGLEALSLSLPPCPGESIIKRPDCAGKHSVASVLDSLGYTSYFFYGGNAYFDNMGSFFGGNGYEVVDASAYSPEEITFKNIWGVSDEDSFRKAISTLDAAAKHGPFFANIMTISNHRPYTYPEGRIDIPTDSKSREGGVKYADWSIGEFFRLARQQPWFDNTIFVIVADHCASSAGKTELPLKFYHIPAMIYAPGRIEPQAVGKFCSQIDLMPTVFALIGLDYDSYFYGANILSPHFTERAFLATYENMGYLQDGLLTVLSPVRRVEQFRVKPTDDNPYNIEPANEIDSALVRRAVAFYQTSTAWN